MTPYIARSIMLLIVFMNVAINIISAISHYSVVYVMWGSYFFILLGLIISHKKDAIGKAMLNIMILTLIAVPVSGLSIPVSLIARGVNLDAVKGNLYILVSIVAVFYLAMRHEKFTIPDMVTKISGYVGEFSTKRFRSSFALYTMTELLLFVVLVIVGASVLG
ncbi:MAG: hypothetical protein V1647_07160 [Pseudomonadota bacterium]